MISRKTSMYPPGFSRESSPIPDLSEYPPVLRAILSTDGTVTKLLEAYFWEPIDVTITSQEIVSEDPFDSGSVQECIRRQVVLTSRLGCVFAMARSVIATDELEPDLRVAMLAEEIGIGRLLRSRRLETFREQISILSRSASDLSDVLMVSPESMCVLRKYRIFWHQKPFVEIAEIFPIDVYRSRG